MLPELMTEVRKGVKEVWLVKKCSKCIEREGEMRRMAVCKEVKYTYILVFLAKTRMISVKTLENGVQICFRPLQRTWDEGCYAPVCYTAKKTQLEA